MINKNNGFIKPLFYVSIAVLYGQEDPNKLKYNFNP